MIICKKCVLDNISVDNLKFDNNGVCHYCNYFEKNVLPIWNPNEKGRKILHQTIKKIKKAGKKNEYDCIIGLSGGIDSSYLLYKSKDWGLRPLVVHVDAGWNSELAVANIEKLINYTGFDLHTEVIDWQDIRKLQVAYLKSGLSNQDVPQDHIFFSSLYHYAIKNKIKYSIGGGNLATESILPSEWHGNAMDAENLLDINKKFGSGKLNNYRTISFFQYYIYYPFFHRLETFRPLNYMPYDKNKAKLELQKIGFKTYEGKHGESIFTKFFQEYYLPKKFNIDKRKAHLSSLILSNQISRDKALEILKTPPYDSKKIDETIDYICSKLEISRLEFSEIMNGQTRHYSEFKNWDNKKRLLSSIHSIYQKIFKKTIKVYS